MSEKLQEVPRLAAGVHSMPAVPGTFAEGRGLTGRSGSFFKGAAAFSVQVQGLGFQSRLCPRDFETLGALGPDAFTLQTPTSAPHNQNPTR